MDIFGIGLPEILLIAVVALIVLGPERLPEAARAAGKAIRDLRNAVEPARSAWTELSSEITGVTEVVSAAPRATIKASRPGEKTTAIPTDNPWKIHPITEGMTEEERDHFMATGVIPDHILATLDEKQGADGASSGNGTIPTENDALDYAAPHAGARVAQPAQAEDLFYPAPVNTKPGTGEEDSNA
ncbi:MAG TPA: Sec-independent protein translocase protein TatB [Chloroflexia bacterium]|nr:Sec-independent protein translocase protein TatB [Chloroflexia bacterium]